MREIGTITAEEAYRKAAACCAASEQCAADIRKRMERWGLDAACQQTVVARLEKEKFIDETRYARCFVRDKFRYNGWGRVKMVQALRLKGISPSCIEKAMDEIEEEEYSRTLQKLLQSKARTLKGGTDYERNGKLVRFGLSRGFEMPLIMRMLHVEEDFA